MASKKVKKSNVRQDDPYDSRARTTKALEEYKKSVKDFYNVEVARSEDLVMHEERKKSSRGAAGPTITNPYILRFDAEQQTVGMAKRTSLKSTKGSVKKR